MSSVVHTESCRSIKDHTKSRHADGNGRGTEDYEYRSKENPKAKSVSHYTPLCEIVSRAPLGRQSRSE